MTKLTEDEHRARAMLMGLEYLEWANAYINRWDLARTGATWIDADTMEPMDVDEISIRVQASLDDDPHVNWGLDWVVKDD